MPIANIKLPIKYKHNPRQEKYQNILGILNIKTADAPLTFH